MKLPRIGSLNPAPRCRSSELTSPSYSSHLTHSSAQSALANPPPPKSTNHRGLSPNLRARESDGSATMARGMPSAIVACYGVPPTQRSQPVRRSWETHRHPYAAATPNARPINRTMGLSWVSSSLARSSTSGTILGHPFFVRTLSGTSTMMVWPLHFLTSTWRGVSISRMALSLNFTKSPQDQGSWFSSVRQLRSPVGIFEPLG